MLPPNKAVKAHRRGTHRTKVPEETVDRLRPLMSAFGITRIANLTGLDRTGIPVVMVCRPNARSSAVFHGKGIDLAAAKASGLMEAIETWHAEHVRLPLRFGSFTDIGSDHVLVDVEGLPRTPAGRFRPELPMLWVEGQDLITGSGVWLPFEIVHADSRVSGPPASGCFAASTNGLASGNRVPEALSHAICEVIERDSTSLWHLLTPAMQDATRLDLSTVDDDVCLAVIDRLTRAQLALAVWETTTDIGVPAFQCAIADSVGAFGHVGHGAGCHPVREIALLRALTEAAQIRTTYIVGSREDIELSDYAPATLEARTLRVRALMRPIDRMRNFTAAGRFEFDTFDEEVTWLVDRLKAAGIRQVIAVDLSRPDCDVSVVRIVVPGLEGSDHHGLYVPGARARARAQR
ncbi:MAG TPA: YcaO-like family protein [Stellaceae bacterium]|nr:YcaO-like family protein [Stellaceae bacterium]